MRPSGSSPLLDRLAWLGRAAQLALEDPVEGLDRALVRLNHLPAPASAAPDPDWERQLHRMLRAAWPCPEAARSEAIFSDANELLRSLGLATGRGAFGGWDDADSALARAIWCLTVHLRPQTVVETGVARGVTSRIVLEALRRNGSGRLWSVDRPPLDPVLHDQIGAAVPERLRDRWTLLRGTSRRVLPGLLRRLSPVGLFVHDSLHTERNLRFELTHAWKALGAAGALVADDVERSGAFERFRCEHPELEAVVAAADDGRTRFGIAVASAAPRPLTLEDRGFVGRRA